jgi:hypothetical protein
MDNDPTWREDHTEADHRHQNDRAEGGEVPGDTDAADIVGRTGEEMPEVAHDDGPGHLDDRHDDPSAEGY